MSAVRAPSFPPLFHGEEAAGQTDPFERACSQALLGCDSGLVVHNISSGLLRAAIVFAPETPLERALPVLIACEIGFQNALGALAPPEVAVHLDWPTGLRINGARCGRFRVAAGGSDPKAVPDWITIGLELPLIPHSPEAPGATPDETCLYEEGCVDVDPAALLEAWVRHSLVWINRMGDDGPAPLNAEWRPLAQSLGEEIALDLAGRRHAGTFVGVDEHFSMLMKQGKDTVLIPLQDALEEGFTP